MGTRLRPLNCPNCGAVINGSKCEYCGTTFFDFAELEIGKPAFMTIKIPGIGADDPVAVAKAVPVSIDISYRPDEFPTISVEFHVMPEGSMALHCMQIMPDGTALYADNARF